MNHHFREVDIEELPHLASGGVDDVPTARMEVEVLGEDLEPVDDPGLFVEENVVVESLNIE